MVWFWGCEEMKLSIITVNLNNAEGLRRTIESVISQTFIDFEYIVIDGGSTDGSVDIIKQYADKIAYWVSEPDKGIYNAMNKGIVRAKGEYCLFLNSGDWLCAEVVLEKVFKIASSDDILYCDLKIVKEHAVIIEHIYPDYLTFKYLFCSTVCHQSVLIKRALFNKYGMYNEKNKIVSDWEFFIIVLSKYNVTYMHLPIFLSYFDGSGMSSIMENSDLIKFERKTVLEKEFPFFYDDYLFFEKNEILKEELYSIKKSKAYRLGKFLLKPLYGLKNIYNFITK